MAQVPLKEGLDEKALLRLARNLKKVHPGLKDKEFICAGLDGLDQLELKDRVKHVAACLREYLPASYPVALKVRAIA